MWFTTNHLQNVEATRKYRRKKICFLILEKAIEWSIELFTIYQSPLLTHTPFSYLLYEGSSTMDCPSREKRKKKKVNERREAALRTRNIFRSAQRVNTMLEDKRETVSFAVSDEINYTSLQCYWGYRSRICFCLSHTSSFCFLIRKI